MSRRIKVALVIVGAVVYSVALLLVGATINQRVYLDTPTIPAGAVEPCPTGTDAS